MVGIEITEQGLLEFGGKGEGVGDEIGHDAEILLSLEHGEPVVVEGDDPLELAKQFDVEQERFRRRGLIFENLNFGLAVKGINVQLADDSDAAHAQKEEVEAAIGEALVLQDATETTDVDQGRTVDIVHFEAGTALNQCNPLIRAECVVGHFAITRLEDMEGNDGVGEENHASQGEEAGDAFEVTQIVRGIHKKIEFPGGIHIVWRRGPSGGARLKNGAGANVG